MSLMLLNDVRLLSSLLQKIEVKMLAGAARKQYVEGMNEAKATT